MKVYFDEKNIDTFMLNIAFESAKISAVLMTVSYYLLAKKLEIPLYIVKNNEILLLAYFKNESTYSYDFTQISDTIKYEFFINPSDKGFFISSENLIRSFAKVENKWNKSFTVITASDIIALFNDKLLNASLSKKNKKLTNFLKELKEILKNNLLK